MDGGEGHGDPRCGFGAKASVVNFVASECHFLCGGNTMIVRCSHVVLARCSQLVLICLKFWPGSENKHGTTLNPKPAKPKSLNPKPKPRTLTPTVMRAKPKSLDPKAKPKSLVFGAGSTGSVAFLPPPPPKPPRPKEERDCPAGR